MTSRTAAIAKIMNSLGEVFAPMDATVLDHSIEWAHGRAAAIKEFRASDEYKSLRRDQAKLYARLFAIAGGKTWFNVLNGSSERMRVDFVTKNCAAIAASRNASIARKLEKAGITDVTETTYTRTNDGFDGIFVIETDSGRKVVTINTIRAGGYNIQCAHLRVLVKVK